MHVLILSVQSLLPTALSKRHLMNNLEVLEKLPHLSKLRAVGSSATAAIYSQTILFTIYSGAFTWCNVMDFEIAQWRNLCKVNKK